MNKKKRKIYNNKYFRDYQRKIKKFKVKNKCKKCGADLSKINRGRKVSYRRILCNNCLKHRGARGEYVFRVIGKYKNGREIYGVTIPKDYIKKYNLLGQKFKIRISPAGKFILYSKIKKIKNE